MSEIVSWEKLQKMIAEQFGVTPDEISVDSRFVEDLGVDSMDMTNFALNLEERLGVVISDMELAEIETAGDLFYFYTTRERG